MSEHRTLREDIVALADEWERDAGAESAAWQAFGPQTISIPFALDRLRALLAAHPDTPAPTGQPLTDDEREALGDACDAEREALGDACDAEREALGDACDAAYDFGDAWVRFTRNGNESMLLPVVERIVAAREQAAADRARAEAGERIAREDERWNTAVDWVLNHGAAYDLIAPFWAYCDGLISLKELRDESVSVGTINRRRERAESRADALAAEDTPAPDPATITAWLAGADERAKEPQTPDDREEVRARLDAPEVTVEDVAEGLRALADEFHEAIEMPQDLPPEAYSRGWLAACGMAERRIRALLAAFDVRRRAEG